ncbi:MAG: DUF3108 domain-containing protein [Firmicutes bacterium]|nr:DUF3108 domain-containing protein [Bacillota bacterium]MCM1400778.1 DUF3108 domain-containing protein [Bacteroides sp.]MCM1477858.1 DUF3108 domain-containing protein [Bacteroides sp.]
MKHLVLSIFASLAALSCAAAVNIPRTSLTYDVMYHLGPINKIAGNAYVDFNTAGNRFYASLQGHSIPWGGKIYTVHTSLSATFSSPRGGVSTENVNGIQGVYTKPEVGQNPRTAPYRTISGGGTLDASGGTMEAVTIMSDMLSIYYYAHQLGFGTMQPGHRVEIPVIENGREQTLYITYNGVEQYSYNGYSSEAYSITFQYTYHGAPDRYPVTCLIGTDNRIPLLFSAHILIGHVEMRYIP